MDRKKSDVFHLGKILVEQTRTTSFSDDPELSTQELADLMSHLLLDLLYYALLPYQLPPHQRDELMRDGLEEGVCELSDMIRWLQMRADRMEYLQVTPTTKSI